MVSASPLLRYICFIVLVVVVVFAFANAGTTTEPPQLCNLVCPKPLPEDVVLMASPERCEDYCQCDPRGAILQHCPVWNLTTGAQLYFNPVAQVCDWPDVSGCTND